MLFFQKSKMWSCMITITMNRKKRKTIINDQAKTMLHINKEKRNSLMTDDNQSLNLSVCLFNLNNLAS